MQLLAFDTETHLIGPGNVIPKLVCFSTAWLDGDYATDLVANGDPDWKDRLREIFEPGKYRLVMHNASFDVAVVSRAMPELIPAIWEKLENGEISDTMIREQLLNLSTSGKITTLEMPDGTEKRISYSLGDVLKRNLGIDISDTKSGDDVWRLNFDKLDGLRADQYPAEAARYASEDAEYTLMVFLNQDSRTETDDGYASLSTETFHAAASYALQKITARGMAIDAERYHEVKAELDKLLSPENMRPLVKAGILVPAIPALPHKRHEVAAGDMVAEWLGIGPDEVEWSRVDDDLRLALEDSGFKFKKPTKPKITQDALKRRVLACWLAKENKVDPSLLAELPLDDLVGMCEEQGVEYTQTDTGAVGADVDTIAELVEYDVPFDGDDISPMQCYQNRKALEKMVTTELPRMTWKGEPADVVHFAYKVLLETARTSSYATTLYPSANGQNVDPRARPIYVPRPGFVLCSADYKALELVCVADTTYKLFGHSEHREKINAGYDLHAYLGSILAADLHDTFAKEAGGEDLYEFFLSTKKSEPDFFKFWRKLAKPTGLGFSSGLGPATMVGHAKSDPYNIDLCAIAEEQYEKDPGSFKATSAVMYHAKRLFDMSDETFEWNSMLLGVALCDRLKGIWLRTYPEMKEYSKWIRGQTDENNGRIYFGDDDDEGSSSLCYTTPLGMHRANCTYTAAVNGRALQSPAAEGFKHAFMDLVRAQEDPTRGSILYGHGYVVNEIHDETLTELRRERAHELAMEVKRIMEEGMRKVITEVDVEVEPCLMERWYKFAEPVFNDNGELDIWIPEAA